jgi:uncharacterized protein YjiS (DUF1127 family)
MEIFMNSNAIDAGSASLGRSRNWALLNVVQSAVAAVADRARAARDREELSQLSDRDLADIGLTRGDIAQLARNPAALDNRLRRSCW